MTTLYDTSTEVDTAEAERLLRRPAKQVRNLWRAGLLKGRMEQTAATASRAYSTRPFGHHRRASCFPGVQAGRAPRICASPRQPPACPVERWRDDSQIVAWHAYKHYATTANPVGAQITIQELRR